jgi:hypothetical protein
MFRYDERINPIHRARMLWKGDDAVNCSNVRISLMVSNDFTRW